MPEYCQPDALNDRPRSIGTVCPINTLLSYQVAAAERIGSEEAKCSNQADLRLPFIDRYGLLNALATFIDLHATVLLS